MIGKLTRTMVRAFAFVLALCATTSAWADTLRVLGDDVAIHSNATDLNRSGYDITTGSLSFNTPSGCSAGDALLFTKLQMISEGSSNNRTYAQTITITVGDKTYTSGKVVGPANESIGNLGTKSVLTYNFPNVPVQAGSSYAITFNNAGSAGIRYGVENTNTYTGYTISLTGSSDNWHPYGAITATKVLSSSPDVGDKILLSNTATSGTADASATKKDFLSVSIPTDLGLPNGSVIRVSKVNLAGWNNTYSNGQDPYGIYINGVRSLNLKGESTYAGSEASSSITLNNATIQVNGSTSSPRLSYAFASNCDLTLGTTYEAAINNASSYTASGKGVTLLHANGTPIIGGGAELAAVRHVSATSGVIVNGNVSGSYPVYEIYAEVISIPTETATISAAGTYTLAGLFAYVSDSGRYSITVNESATLDIDAATTVSALTLNVASGKTLTVTGSALTVASGLRVTGKGYVNLTGATVSGTLKGDGTVVYTGTATPSGLVFTDTAWEGTLWLENKTGVTAWEPTSYGSANSTIRMTGIQLYFNTLSHSSENVSFDGTLEVTDIYSDGTAASYGIEINNGFSSATTTFGALKGNGTIQDTDQGATPLLVFNDASEFAGTIKLSYGGKKVRIGTSGTVAGGQICIAAGKSVTVASGKAWTGTGGVVVNGTLTLEDSTSTLTGTVTGSGTIVGGGTENVPNIASLTQSGWTGTVEVNGAATVQAMSGSSSTQFMNSGATFKVASGYVALTSAAGLTGNVSVNSGASLYVVDSTTDNLSFGLGTVEGTINISGCSALTALTLNVGTERSITASKLQLPSSATLATVNVVVKETHGDGGSISLTSTAGLSTVAGRTYNYSVLRADGETVSATLNDGVLTYEPAIGGASTIYDITFKNNSQDVGKYGYRTNPGTFTYTCGDGMLCFDTAATFNNDAWDDTTGLYLRCTPYFEGAASRFNSLNDFTTVVVGQMSAAHNTIFIHLGSSNSGSGLVIATTDNDNEVIIAKNTGTTVDFANGVKATVPNAATARHAYVIVKSGSVFNVWVDGVKRGSIDVGNNFALGTNSHAGLQVGKQFGGSLLGSLSGVSSSDAGVINVIRIFDYAISESQSQAIFSAYPYIPLGGLYTRTIAADANLSATDAWTKSGGDTTHALPEGSTVDAVFYNPSATLTVDAGATLTVNADLTLDKLTIGSTSGSALSVVSDGTHSVQVSDSAIINSPLTITYGALNLAGTPVQLGTDATLCFDCSALDLSEVYQTTRYQLTGLMDQDDEKVTVVVPTAVARTASKNYNASGYYELVVTPDHEAGSEVYFGSGYLDGAMTGSGGTGTVYLETDHTHQTALFPGDTMVIDDNSSLWQDQVWVSNTFIGNLKITRTTPMALHNGELTNPILASKTIAVEEGASLTISKHTSNALTLGALAINGAGAVALSGPLTLGGAVAGTATVAVNGSVSVASTGSIANTISGSGTITYATFPSTTPAGFSSWTGTVALPSLDVEALNLNAFGVSGSKVALAGITGGYLAINNLSINPELVLNGDVSIPAMSAAAYTLAKISGSGNLSLASNNEQPTSFTIAEVAEDYTGTISSSLTTPVTIATLVRGAGVGVVPGTKLLDLGDDSANITVTTATVGGTWVPQANKVVSEDRGIYIVVGTIFSVY